MDGKFGNPEYMDRIMGTFVKEMSPSLRETMTHERKKGNKKEKIEE